MYSLRCLQQLSVYDCRSLIYLSNMSSLASLQSVSLTDCPNLCAIPDMNNQFIRRLSISKCDGLISSLSNPEKFMSLEHLSIYSDPSLWPKGVDHPINLRELRLRAFCGNLGYFPAFSGNLDYFPWPFSISNAATPTNDVACVKQHFVSLVSLELYGWPEIKSPHEQMQHLPTLRNLIIWNFNGLECLPEWLGGFRNLEELRVWCCSELKQLPSIEAMQRLANLQELEIFDCPLLEERCTRESGTEWPRLCIFPELEFHSQFQEVETNSNGCIPLR